MAFATPAELTAYTKGAIPADDPRSQPLLDAATRAIQNYAGWHISPRQGETFVLDSDGGNLLHVPTLALRDVISVTPRGQQALSPTSYEWSELGLIRRFDGYFADSFRGYSVTVEHGYDSVPDLKQVVLQVTAQALSSPTGATREQAGAVAMSWATTAPGVSGGLSLLQRDLATVDMYKLPGRA